MDEPRNGEAVSTPSRMSMAALCSPASSPRPPAHDGRSNGTPVASKDTDEEQVNGQTKSLKELEDVEMTDIHQTARGSPVSKAKGLDGDTQDAEEAKSGVNGHQLSGEAVEVDQENEGEDEEEDDEDDDEDDEDDDDEDESDEDGDDDSDSSEDAEDGGTEGEAAAQAKSAEGASDGQATNGTNAEVAAEKVSAVDGGDVEASEAGKEGGTPRPEHVNGKKDAKLKHKKKEHKRRSPDADAAPDEPPPRPTVRLRFTLSKRDEDAYMTTIPDEVFKILKDKNDPWARWYESSVQVEATAAAPADGEDDGADTNGMGEEDLALQSELGGLARLLAKYPAQETNGKVGKNGKGKGKKSDMDYDIGEYDTRDPFVDDSELNVDEPTFSAKPSADGFFVAEGEIELQEAERNKIADRQDTLMAVGKRGQMPPGFGQAEDDAGGAGAMFLELGPTASNTAIVNAMLSRYAIKLSVWPDKEKDEDIKPRVGASTPSRPNGLDGSRESPIKVDDVAGEEEERPMPPFEPIQAVKYPVNRVSRRLEDEFIKLRQMAAKESWLKKSKFPPDLRDPLVNACRIALAQNEFDDNFFNWLPQIFPYNRHTLNKYVRRQFFNDHTDFMKRLMALNEEGFKRQIDQTLPRLKKDYDQATEEWNARGSREGTPAAAATVTPAATDKAPAAAEVGGEEEEEPVVNKNAKPVKRWLWTELFRETLFTIITIDNAITELKTEKNSFEGVSEKISVINQRKDIYKRLIELWPEKGWTTTTALSNQHGLYKRKVEKFAQMLHDQPSSSLGMAE